MTKKIVSKFGGSSMADFTAMTRSGKISIKQNSSMVLVSATYGTTDQIISLINLAQNGQWQECETLLENIKKKHFDIADNLKNTDLLLNQLNLLFEEINTLSKGIYFLQECSPKAKDQMLSFGERISSLLFSEVLKTLTEKEVKLFDIRTVLITDSNFGKATPNIAKIREECSAHLKLNNDTIYVSQGFIGSDESGATTTLGRGGSDYSAALIAEGLKADLLEIWTDVAGIATTDPKICKNIKMIDEISYNEASEMAQYGAKILHPTTILPAMREKIPVFVGSSIEDDKKGTWIREHVEERPLVRAIAKRSNQSLLTIKTPKMLNAYGFMSKIFDAFSAHHISIDCVTTSEIAVAITVDEETLSNRSLIAKLETLGEVKIEKGYDLISMIGNNINRTKGISTKILNSIPEINIRMMSLGASDYNFNFLVNKEESNLAINNIHSTFIEN